MTYYYFYILRSTKNGKLYLGFTRDPFKRHIKHNSGTEPATKLNIPYELIYFSGFKNKEDAVACERYFKTTSGWKRLKNMLERTLIQEKLNLSSASLPRKEQNTL